MTAQKIDTIKIQRMPQTDSEQTYAPEATESKLTVKDWVQLLTQFVTVGGDFAN